MGRAQSELGGTAAVSASVSLSSPGLPGWTGQHMVAFREGWLSLEGGEHPWQCASAAKKLKSLSGRLDTKAADDGRGSWHITWAQQAR